MNVPKTLRAANGEQIAFYEHAPALADGTPIIIFFHGRVETGDGTVNTLGKLKIYGPVKHIEENKFNYPFIVLSPQLHSKYQNSEWPLWYATEMIKHARSLGTGKIFVTGLSLGGGLVWNVLDDDSLCKQIAGAAPVCGTATFSTVEFIHKYKIPVWGFHGFNDTTIGCGNTISAIDRIGPELGKYTIYSNTGHNAWDYSYTLTNETYTVKSYPHYPIKDTSYTHKPNLWEWFLEKAGAIPLPPIVVEPPTTPPRTVVKVVLHYSDGETQEMT